MSVALTASLQFGEVVVDLHSAIFGVEDIGYNVRSLPSTVPWTGSRTLCPDTSGLFPVE